MNEMIQKPDANPVIFAAANFLALGGLGYFLMGQQPKAIRTWIITVLCYTVGFFCIGLGPLVGLAVILAASYDAYLLGQKLQEGGSIGINENALELLDKIMPK